MTFSRDYRGLEPPDDPPDDLPPEADPDDEPPDDDHGTWDGPPDYEGTARYHYPY